MNWDDPEARFHLIESVGLAEYNRRYLKHLEEETITTINGHDIRKINTRFGLLYFVDGTDMAFSTLQEAEKHAELEP